jgi:hypothetical protein
MMNQKGRKNRFRFSREELVGVRGEWVAFDLNCERIVAHDRELGGLEDQLAALGLDPQTVILEYIPDPDRDESGERLEFL